MSDMETSLFDEEFIEEVRNSLAGLDASKIPDETILQAKDRLVEPALNDQKTFKDSEQEPFDNASIFWSAELAFDAWLTFTRLRDREIETFVDPKQYKDNLKSRTDKALNVLGVTRPPDTPNAVITVKHDGVKRRVNLDQEWVLGGSQRNEGSE